MKTFLSKFLPLILAVANVVGAAFVPAIASFWAHHASIAAILNAVALFFPQPHK